jgi:hypothetical protein
MINSNLKNTKMISNFFLKVINYYKNNGLLKTLFRIIIYNKNIIKKFVFLKKVIRNNNIEDKFTWIYYSNFWSNGESLSGAGSTIKSTQNIRQRLPELIVKFNIKTVFDAPCGDLNWMKLLLPTLNVNYIGADIVAPLVDKLNESYGDESTKFVKINLITDLFPSADLMICRDCLFHLSYDDIHNVLTNFLKSDIKYLLTTTYLNEYKFKNRNIISGDFRVIDLFLEPFSFSTPPLDRFDDWLYPEQPREMCLWSKEQITEVVKFNVKYKYY